jgi:hypothetical protein
MTTAARPTFHPAVGLENQGYYRLTNGTRFPSFSERGTLVLRSRALSEGGWPSGSAVLCSAWRTPVQGAAAGARTRDPLAAPETDARARFIAGKYPTEIFPATPASSFAAR